MPRRVAILYSADACLAHGDPADAIAVGAGEVEVEAVEAAIRANGWESERVLAEPDLGRTLRSMRRSRADVVFHLAASIGGEARMEAAAAWMLEWARIPYTGPGPLALAIALEKPLARAALAAAGVAIPEGFSLARANGPLPGMVRERVGARWIVKPSREDASHGIGIESVVTDEAALRERARRVIATYAQPALVEEFVEGREINVSILEDEDGPRLLPLSEIDFARFPEGRPRLVTYAAKWDEASPECAGTEPVAARPMTPELEGAIRAAALGAWNALSLAGHARVDLRVHAERGPLVLDVNPNPDISPGAGFARAAARAGLPYDALVARIIETALRRARESALRRAGRPAADPAGAAAV